MTIWPPLAAAAATTALLAAPAAGAQSRDQIRIVGSSTVFPYTQAVAEQFVGMTGMQAPVVESTGTGGGMQDLLRRRRRATTRTSPAPRAR